MTKKQQLRKQGDELWRFAVIKKWGQDCVCGDPAAQAHHNWYKGSYGHLRYNLDNGVPLCMKHHFIIHHRDPKEVEEMIREYRGEKWYQDLRKIALEKHESYQTISWYEENIKRLQDYLEQRSE